MPCPQSVPRAAKLVGPQRGADATLVVLVCHQSDPVPIKTPDASTIENGTVVYNQELLVTINKMNTSMRNEILLLGKNTLIAVVEDQNGVYWLLGRYNGLDITTGTASSGLAQADRNGYQLTFTGGEKELAPTVSSGIIAGLTS